MRTRKNKKCTGEDLNYHMSALDPMKAVVMILDNDIESRSHKNAMEQL